MNSNTPPKTVWRSQVFTPMTPRKGRPPKAQPGASLPKAAPPPTSVPCVSCAHRDESSEGPHCAGCKPRSETRSNWALRTDPPPLPSPAQPAASAVKYDDGKPRMDLLDSYAIEQMATVLGFGAQKYPAHNWRKGIHKSRLLAAALRHLFAYLRGEDLDPESGLSHVAHAMCCCMFLLGLAHRSELDDRFKPD